MAFLEATHNIPLGIGVLLTELGTGLAVKRTNARMRDMFDFFSNRLRDLGEDKIDREWFKSEEFQTLLLEALRQLNVTHDREKLEMLGVALANSGADTFKEEDRKDLFVRFIRELTRQHINLLCKLLPEVVAPFSRPHHGEQPVSEKDWNDRLIWQRRPTLFPQHDDDMLILQVLHGYGLVEEKLKASIKEPRISSKPTHAEVQSALREFSKQLESPPVTRSFRLSSLGYDFAQFIGLTPGAP